MMISPDFDVSAATDVLRYKGRGSLPGLLAADSLAAVQAAIPAIPRWTLVTTLGGKHINLDAAAMDAMPPAQRAEFDRRVTADAVAGFQYLYETFAIYDKWHAGVLRGESPALADLFEWLNSEAFLAPMRDILDAPDIAFCDGQLTRYRAGHFLTTHDDGVAGKNRVAAYVLSLSETWQADWGGNLEFYSRDGSVEDAFTPTANTLSLFKVPHPHAVTRVADTVAAHRLSITGWLRHGADPGP
tara:strand:- start:3 stop:731 length:729 start_codon:yes stop_codon:yes gene_type:complete